MQSRFVEIEKLVTGKFGRCFGKKVELNLNGQIHLGGFAFVLAIAFESEDEEEQSRRERLRAFVEHHGINYIVLDGRAPGDSAEALPGLKNVKGFPVEILIDRNGDAVEVRNGYGYTKRWARKLERELVELLD